MILDSEFMRRLPNKLSLSFSIVSDDELNERRKALEAGREQNRIIDSGYDFIAISKGLDSDNKKEAYETIEVISSGKIYLHNEVNEVSNGVFSDKKFRKLDLSKIDISRTSSLKSLFSNSEFEGILDISSLDTKHIKDFSYMFYGTEVKSRAIYGLEALDTSSATNMAAMFSDCKALLLLNGQISKFNTHNVKDMSEMFRGAMLVNAEFKLDVTNVERFVSMFRNATIHELDSIRSRTPKPLGKLTFKNFDPINGKDFRYMFDGCRCSLIDISNIDFSNVPYNCKIERRYMEKMYPFSHMLARHSSLPYAEGKLIISKEFYDIIKHNRTVVFGKSTGNTEISNMNLDADRLYIDAEFMDKIPKTEKFSIRFRKVDKESLRSLIDKIVTLGGEVERGDYVFMNNGDNNYTLFSYKKITLANNYGSRGIFSGRKIGSISFRGIDTTGCTDMTSLFEGSTIDKLDISRLNTSQVDNMTRMFANAMIKELVGLNLIDTRHVVSMRSMFENSSINEVDLSNFDTSNVRDMSSMFASASITNIIGLEGLDVSKVESMAEMFMVDWGNYTAIKIDCSKLENWRTDSLLDMQSMFKNARLFNINSVNKLNTSKVKNMIEVFKGCKIEEAFHFNLSLDSLEVSDEALDSIKGAEIVLSTEANNKITDHTMRPAGRPKFGRW